MNKTSLVLLALCASAPLLAQAPGGLTVSKGDSSITLYGILDAGMASVAHTANFSDEFLAEVSPFATKTGNGSAIGMFNGGISQSRYGLKGSTGLADGWKGIFTLEGAINVPNGVVSNAAASMAHNTAVTATGGGPEVGVDSSISGQLFSRAAYIGVSSDTYGTLTIGRNTALMLDFIPAFDPLGGAQLFTPLGFSGSYGGSGGTTDNARLDSSLKYSLKVNDFKFAFLHKFGGVAGASSAKSSDQLLVNYEHGNFGAVVAYQSYKDAFSVGNPNGTTQPLGTITLSAFDTKGTSLAAHYKLNPVTLTLGYQKLAYSAPSNPTSDLQMTELYGFVVSHVTTTGFDSGEKDLTILWGGASWKVSDQFTAALGYYHIAQNDYSGGAAVPGAKGTGNTVYYSALLDYNLSKAVDVYFGYMGTKVNDSMAVGYTNDSNATTGVGLRYKF